MPSRDEQVIVSLSRSEAKLESRLLRMVADDIQGRSPGYAVDLITTAARFDAALQQPASEVEAEKGRLREALELMVLSSHDESLIPDELTANDYEARGLLKTERDICDEYETWLTKAGAGFVRAAFGGEL